MCMIILYAFLTWCYERIWFEQLQTNEWHFKNERFPSKVHMFSEHASFLYVTCVLFLYHSLGSLRHARFREVDGKRKWAVFPFNLSSHNQTYIAKYLFSTISTEIWETSLSWYTKCSLPVAVFDSNFLTRDRHIQSVRSSFWIYRSRIYPWGTSNIVSIGFLSVCLVW